MIIAFTGHRPSKLGGYKENPITIYVREELTKLLLQLKPDKCISGMALGVDQIACEICINLNIPFIAAIPCDGQDSVWKIQATKDHYYYLLSKAEEKIVVSPGPYEINKMQLRNEYMVDRCDILVAVFDGSSGGTSKCVKYAESKNKQIYTIDPKDFNK